MGHTTVRVGICRRPISGQEGARRVANSRREEKHAFAAMREPEGSRIDDPICPSISKSLEISSHVGDATTAIEPEEERHVLDEDPRWLAIGDQPEDTSNEPRASPKDPARPSGL
jgi:hypothetical protein